MTRSVDLCRVESTPAANSRVSALRKVLLSMMVIGALGTTLAAGTFASMTGSATDAASTFATGTIVVGENKGQNPAGDGSDSDANFCISSGASTVIGDDASDPVEDAANLSNCGALYNLTLQKPGSNSIAPGSTLNLTVKNQGNLSGQLRFYASTPCAGTHSSMCAAVQMNVDVYTDINRTIGGDCLWGGGQANSAVVPCNWTDTTKTWDVFDASAEHNFNLTMPPGSVRYLSVGVRLRDPAGLAALDATTNNFQGRSATVGIGWRLVQT
jgi:hypothetical protein